MTETRTPYAGHSEPSGWHPERHNDIWWFCSPTGVKLGRIAGHGVLMVKDKRSKREVPLTADDIWRVTEAVVDDL